jgi:hypothetical protein
MLAHIINPHLMTINGYTSRNMPHPEVYAEMLERRMQAKKSGDKQTANALKLIANTTYGATLNQYNELYDPLKARSVCISGQLYLLELANHLIQDVPNLKVVQLNTDGIMIEFDDHYYNIVLDITNEWQQRTGFSLEEDRVWAIYQKDVNNYVEIAPDGTAKIKGGYLVRGIAPAGAFNVNNNAVIVAEAIKDYFVHDVPPEVTIVNCDDISKFQLIAKAGSKYKDAYHIVNGERQPIQRVNRVYATNDPTYGKLYKVKAADDSEAKIERLPEHCIIDNTAIDDPEHTKVDKIDKDWYIAQAKDGINKFLGIEEKKTKERKSKMPTAKTQEAPKLNVCQKLLTARCKFLESQVQKSGKNMKLKYKYFELDDIVPVALPIFQEVGLLPVTTFTNEVASMALVNVDDPMDIITFTSPMREIEPIISNTTGGEVTNAIQRLGAVETYQRRYLYMIALDIVEADEMEAMTGMAPEVTIPVPAPKVPVTPLEREEIKQKLTAPEAAADELQLNALKEAVKRLRKAGNEDKAVALALETKGFTAISKTRCEELIKEINAEVGNA